VVNVLRPDGLFNCIKGGAFTNWILMMVEAVGNAATVYPALTTTTGSAGLRFTKVQISDLAGGWETEFGIATERLAGSQSQGQTYTHEANAIIEFEVTTLPSAGSIEISFRKQDANNLWKATVDSTGTLRLFEVVGGSGILRIFSGGVISAGERIVIWALDSTIQLHDPQLRRGKYAAATNFQTETAGEVESLGTGGVASDIVAWPMNLSGQPLAYLEAFE
jgi:hypothetical protein